MAMMLLLEKMVLQFRLSCYHIDLRNGPALEGFLIIKKNEKKEILVLTSLDKCSTFLLFDLLQNYSDYVGKKSTFRLLNRGSAKALDKVVELDGMSTTLCCNL
jgi:hypothetical protein